MESLIHLKQRIFRLFCGFLFSVFSILSALTALNKDFSNEGALIRIRQLRLEMPQMPWFNGFRGVTLRCLAAFSKAAITSLDKDKAVRVHKVRVSSGSSSFWTSFPINNWRKMNLRDVLPVL